MFEPTVSSQSLVADATQCGLNNVQGRAGPAGHLPGCQLVHKKAGGAVGGEKTCAWKLHAD